MAFKLYKKKMRETQKRFFVGTSGWMYPDWRGKFYPEKLPTKNWFGFYSQQFTTVEINATFYHLMKEETFKNWGERAPQDFIYSIKMWRQITHRQRLIGAWESVSKFISNAELIGKSLGPILIQLPPNLKCDSLLLADFLDDLPEGFSYVVEFRKDDWFTDEIYNILKAREIGFVIFHHPKIKCPIVVTSKIIYLRFHGKDKLYSGKYEEKNLVEWADFIHKHLKKNHSVFAYFNNDFDANAIDDAFTLRRLVSERD